MDCQVVVAAAAVDFLARVEQQRLGKEMRAATGLLVQALAAAAVELQLLDSTLQQAIQVGQEGQVLHTLLQVHL
jgi:hypothetical protein